MAKLVSSRIIRKSFLYTYWGRDLRDHGRVRRSAFPSAMGLRPGSIADANDERSIQQSWYTQGELTKRCVGASRAS